MMKFGKLTPVVILVAVTAAMSAARAQTATEYMSAFPFFEAVKAKLTGTKKSSKQVDWSQVGAPVPVYIGTAQQ